MAKSNAEVKKILFVCTGNTCRSPLAAELFNRSAPEGYAAESAGIFAASGSPASRGSVKAAKKHGVSLANHRSRTVTGKMLEEAYQVRCLTKTHADMLHSDYPDYREKILVLSERDISDPFGGNDKVYAKAAEEINAAVQAFVEELTQSGGNIQ